MNIFLPYADDIDKSVQSLDNKRLCKQILECKTILDIANEPARTDGYANHPVVRHYISSKRQIKFVRYYGYKCCKEYEYRFGKKHAYADLMPQTKYFLGVPTYTPVYIEKADIIMYYTVDHDQVSELFKCKLCDKWHHDKYPPKWTKREMPPFYYEHYMEFAGIDDMLKMYKEIQEMKKERTK